MIRPLTAIPMASRKPCCLPAIRFGTYLADTWSQINYDDLTYIHVAEVFEEVDRQFSGGRYKRLIRGNFDMRDIGYVRVGPQLASLWQKKPR